MCKLKRMLKIVAGAVAIGLIMLILLITNSFTGNPLSASIANKRINQYVQQNYSFITDLDYLDTKTTYNFKTGAYGKRVTSKQSLDTTFYVYYKGKGRINDTFVGDVQGKFTTYIRLEKELDKVLEKIIKDQFPYDTDIIIAGFFYEKGEEANKLSLDMNLDVTNLPLEAYLTVYVFSDEISYEVLRDILVEIDQLMQEHSLAFTTYTVVVEKPRAGEEAPVREALHLFDFPVEKMDSDDLITVIQEHQAEWEKTHNK